MHESHNRSQVMTKDQLTKGQVILQWNCLSFEHSYALCRDFTLWPILIFSVDNWNAWKYQTNCLFCFKFFTLLHNHTLGYVRKDVKIFLLGTKMDTILASKSKISSTTFWNFKFLCSSSVPLLFWWVFFGPIFLPIDQPHTYS